MRRGGSVDQLLKPLNERLYQAYLSNIVQLADILEWVLKQVGRSKVWQTSFSISEEFVRRLYFIEKTGLITEFNLLLDHKATNKTLAIWPFLLQTVQNVHLADNHSKMLLILSEAGDKIVVITSQNLTRGNRHESTLVSSDPSLFDNLHSQVTELIKSKSVPLYELYSRRVNEDREDGVTLSLDF